MDHIEIDFLDQPRATVQLLHELPDGTDHIDWLIATDTGDGPLISFRLDRPLHLLADGEQITVTRIADHRPLYLEYEGDISGGRGTVKRIARGVAMDEQVSANKWLLHLHWQESAAAGSIRQHLQLERKDEDFWTLLILR